MEKICGGCGVKDGHHDECTVENEPSAASGGHSSDIGVEQYMPTHDHRPDLFEFEREYWSFPCAACKHRHAAAEHCQECRHYAL